MNARCRMRRTLSGWMLGCTVVLGVLPLPGILPAQSLRVSGTPSLRLSSPESGSGMFETVVGTTRLGDGRIVVGNRGEHALLVLCLPVSSERVPPRLQGER